MGRGRGGRRMLAFRPKIHSAHHHLLELAFTSVGSFPFSSFSFGSLAEKLPQVYIEP